MQVQQKPRATPIMVWKTIGLALSMAVGFGAAFYAGYHSLPYVLAPSILLEISCSSLLVLISRYHKGVLFQGHNPNGIKAGFWLGCIALFVSVVGCFVLGITSVGKIKGFVYREYGLYAALVPCVLAVFWSSVLIYDSRIYWRMWQGVLGGAMVGVHVIYRS